MYTIHNAHSKGVTAVAVTTRGHRIISGGGEGQVSESRGRRRFPGNDLQKCEG
jgi:hypothetical protein